MVTEPYFGFALGPVGPNVGPPKIFFKNLASSVTRYHGQLSSCTISEKSNDRILRKLSDERTGRRTEGQTDGQTDRRTDGQTDGGVFNKKVRRNPVMIKLNIMFQRETVRILFKKTKEKQVEES